MKRGTSRFTEDDPGIRSPSSFRNQHLSRDIMNTSTHHHLRRKFFSLLVAFLFVAMSFSILIPSRTIGGEDAVTPGGTRTGAAVMSGDPGDDDSKDQNVAWKDITPISSLTMVGMDNEGYADDFGYLAAVPTAVFREDDQLYSSPVLFYEHPFQGTEKEMTLNANQGLGYFLEDWHTVNEGSLDTIQMINMPDDTQGIELALSSEGTDITIVNDNIYALSSEIALANWEYADTAVLAVVDDDFEFSEKETAGTITSTVPAGQKATEQFQGEKDPDPQDPTYHNFTIDEGYKFITAEMTWDTFPGSGDVTDRGRDPDMQIYDWQLGEVAASENWNVLTGAYEYCESYIYHDPGDWGVAVTYMPTESMNPAENPFLTEEELLAMFSLPPDYEPPERNTDLVIPETPEAILQNPMNTARYTIDVEMFVGNTSALEDESPFMGREGTFTLDWDGGTNLGLIILGPSGATVASATGDAKPKEITIPELGMGQYSVAAISLDDSNPDVPFTIDYSWSQVYPEKLASSFESAANGAVIASIENAPLLYVKKGSVPSSVEDALNTLGTKDVILVGTDGTGGVEDDIEDIRSWLQEDISVEKLNSAKKAYQYIRERTGENDIVFTTVNSFTEWYIGGFGNPIGGEREASLFVGPAALSGAFHGAPVLVTDGHQKLSASQAWHNEFWRVAYSGRLPPSVGCMVLTGHQTYDYLEEMGLDDPDGMESIVTVAGQFDLGTSWDRCLVGAAAPGRICGTPVDTSHWVARSGLYPVLIFANPSVTGEVTMTTGYEDQNNPVERQVTLDNVFLQTWVSYQHRFNQRACGDDPVNNYWACDYVTADGIKPYHDPSPDPIDDGVNQHGPNTGQFWPDLTISEVVPFYSEKLGYNDVFSTTFLTTMDNLNQGAILWFEVMHGGNRNGGVVGWWEPGNHGDDEIIGEPWRGYETNGNVFEPDSVFMDKNYGLDAPYNNNPTEWGWHDGIIIAIVEQWHTIDPFGEYGSDGRDWDAEMENIHSVGFAGGSCLIANTYLHLSLIRHGSVFQIIDPWLTSWYCAFAIETFLKDVALGDTVGEAYEKGIRHVGIEYMTNSWWWDIFENVVYYGDPDLRVYAPATCSWEMPEVVSSQDISSGGHTPAGASDHPNEIEDKTALEYTLIGGMVAIVAVAVGAVVIRKKKEEEPPFAEKLE